MIDIERTLRLLDVEAESNFVQAEAIDAINYLLIENARLQEENDAWRMDGGSCAEEVKRLREENARLRNDLKNAIFSDIAYTKEIERQDVLLRKENAGLREALKPFVPETQWIDPAIPDTRPIDVMVLAGELRAARAAILGNVKAEGACPEPDEGL